MEIFDYILQPAFAVVGFVVLFVLNSWFFDKVSTTDRSNLLKGSIGLFLVLFGFVIFVLSLPIDAESKSQILSFLGIVISAGVALSSTTLLGNLIAGIMNNFASRFKSGDLIEIDGIKGRVTKKSFFYTEIQLPDSNFTTIPNLFLATKPVKNTRKSDTVISTEVSLGYDVSRKLIETCLIKGAEKTGLEKPYVYITSLGDFSVVYRISGFLKDTDSYFSTSYSLNKYILDALHEQNIEIVSPTFMNQRQIGDKLFISKPKSTQKDDDKVHEDQVFDKAKTFEKLETTKEKLEKELKQAVTKEEKAKIKEQMQRIENVKNRVEDRINEE